MSMGLFDFFLKAFISFLVIANPIGVTTIFVGLTAHAEPREIHALARKAALVAFGVLVIFAFFGGFILQKFGITIAAFRVSGGILLFTIASRMLFGNAAPEAQHMDRRALIDREDIAVFPLGVPLIAGPGCITLAIVMMEKTTHNEEIAVLIAAITLAMGLTWVCLRTARKIQGVIGASGVSLVTRIMGLLLAARAVQIIAEGIQGLNFKFMG